MTKQELRERIWTLLEARGVARFPRPLRDRIPNFVGAEAAAARAAALPEWAAAHRLKSNPDAPQRALRLRALQEGKLVFMAVPRLRDARCFLRLDPGALGAHRGRAATIKGALALGDPVEPRQLGRVDLIVTPVRVIRTERAFPAPTGILWEELSDAQLQAIPALRRLRR